VSGLLHLMLLERGVFGASRLMYCASAAMTGDDVDHAVDALDDALRALVPDLGRVARHLLV
jgi:glutamate-1-semialdehyde aminotransferase